jgi:hypothetical protein
MTGKWKNSRTPHFSIASQANSSLPIQFTSFPEQYQSQTMQSDELKS